MNSFEDITIAIKYSYDAMTWITWLVLAILLAKTIQSFVIAYRDNNSYEDMKKNTNKRGLAEFYTGIITAMLCVLVFFLPYLMK